MLIEIGQQIGQGKSKSMKPLDYSTRMQSEIKSLNNQRRSPGSYSRKEGGTNASPSRESKFIQQKSRQLNQSILGRQEIIELLRLYHADIEEYSEKPNNSKEAHRREQELVREITFVNKVKNNNEKILKDRIKYLEEKVWGNEHKRRQTQGVNFEIQCGVLKIKLQEVEKQRNELKIGLQRLHKEINWLKFDNDRITREFKIREQNLIKQNNDLLQKIAQAPSSNQPLLLSVVNQPKPPILLSSFTQTQQQKRRLSKHYFDQFFYPGVKKEARPTHDHNLCKQKISVLEDSCQKLRNQIMKLNDYIGESEAKHREQARVLRQKLVVFQKEKNEEKFTLRLSAIKEKYTILTPRRRTTLFHSRDKSNRSSGSTGVNGGCEEYVQPDTRNYTLQNNNT